MLNSFRLIQIYPVMRWGTENLADSETGASWGIICLYKNLSHKQPPVMAGIFVYNSRS
jgi:hypothetical protein